MSAANGSIVHSTQLRVRYADTDQMGFVYYGNYAAYFEVGRVELVRALGGVSYADLEHHHGVMMPVLRLEVQYLAPARYDDLLTIETTLQANPTLKVHFTHRVLNQAGQLLVTGAVTLVFVRIGSLKPVRPPQPFLDTLDRYRAQSTLATA
jgi:acyl-CoA thioester hydrolase